MSARILQNVLRLRSLKYCKDIQFYQVQQRRYAISVLTSAQSKEQNILWYKNTNSIPERRHETTKTNLNTKKKLIDLDVFIGRLYTQFQTSGYVGVDWFEKILLELEAQPERYSNNLALEQINFLLGACCPELMPAQTSTQRFEFFQRLWNFLDTNVMLNKEHFLLKLRVLRENQIELKDYKDFLNKASKVGLNELQLYDELLDVACANGNMQQATELLLAMRNSDKATSERNFNALLIGHARNKDLNGLKNVLEGMEAAGLQISFETQTTLVVAYLENEQFALATEILDKFKEKFEATQIIAMLRTALLVNIEKDLLKRLVQKLPKSFTTGTNVPTLLCNVCIELLHKGKFNEVQTIIATLPTPQYNENISSDSYGNVLIQELIGMNIESTKVLEFAMQLKNSGKNTRALQMTAEIAMRRSPPLGLPYLDCLSKIEELRPHYFWPLMMYNFRRQGESGIIRTLKIMSQYDLASDAETFKQYVLPRLSVTLENPQQALKMFDDIGVKTTLILTPIVANMLMQQQTKEVLSLLELYPTKLQVNDLIAPLVGLAVHARVTKNFQQYANLVAVIMRKSENRQIDFVGLLLNEMLSTRSRLRNDLNSLQCFVNEMHNSSLIISVASYDNLVATLRKCFQNKEDLTTTLHLLQKMCNRTLTPLNINYDNTNHSSFIKHPRDMTMEELECHLIELEAKHMNTRGVLRRLLQVCVRENQLNRALQIKAKCDELKIINSPGMLASVLDLYIKLKDLPNAEASLKNLQQSFPAFQIDEHKQIDFAALLVLNDQYDAGIKMLQQRAERHKITGGGYVLKNVWYFLTNVAQHSARVELQLPPEENLTRNTFKLLQQLGYCRSNNTILGPIIREWLLRGNLLAAIEELRHIAKQYKHTPLQFELISLLVKLSNNQPDAQQQFPNITNTQAQGLLKDVTNIVSSVHGIVNMNSSLLLAFAESGTDNQLRRLVINPEFRINEEQLLKNCEHLSSEGAVFTLLRLARGARGLNRVIDEQNIYNMLLNNFIKDNNYTAALEFYECLEADDELKVSQEFLRNLVNLLKVNKLEIPSNIALRAQVI